ncbi:MAG TPA: hypothetical protein VF192_04865 [Longimicrobiales bacterium]
MARDNGETRDPQDAPSRAAHSLAEEPPAGTDELAEGRRAELERVAAAGDRLPRVEVTFGPREPSNPRAQQLWEAIRFHTERIAFPEFDKFVDRALCRDELKEGEKAVGRRLYRERIHTALRGNFIPGADMYAALKVAAEIFLLLRCGVCPPPREGPDGPSEVAEPEGVFDDIGRAPRNPDELTTLLTGFIGQDRYSYIRNIIRNVFPNENLDASPFCALSVGLGPCLLELIWSYWHEEGMLVQTMKAITRRFQNVHAPNGRDPLGELELDPLRPLSGFIWGYIQDEPNRLSVARRAYEYQHHYGIGLYGKVTAGARLADTRSRFLQAFHDLLRLTDLYYREASDNTVTPDAFPLLIALRDLHLILAEGAHNQFRDLPWQARVEMLVQQWLLARPETRDFLRGRLMVPYPEKWMGAVDAMKRLQGWTDTSVIHFRDLAVYGERLLLSVRYISWDRINNPAEAENWALTWRAEVQGYIHAYRMATGVSLSDDVVEVSRAGDARYLEPSVHLRNRLLEQRRSRSLPSGEPRAGLPLEAVARSSVREQ